MTTVSYEVCTEEQWTELNASLRQLALKWGTEEVLDTPIGHNLKRCTQYYKFYPLNYIRAFLPKVEAWFVGMIDLHIFYIDTWRLSMTASRSDEPTIGSFVRSEVPDEGDKSIIQYDGELYRVENMGVFLPAPSNHD